MTNLKKVLMELGNKLVTERGYEPIGDARFPLEFLAELKGDRSTGYITIFTMWLNENPDAREILKEMGVDWPMPSRGGR